MLCAQKNFLMQFLIFCYYFFFFNQVKFELLIYFKWRLMTSLLWVKYLYVEILWVLVNAYGIYLAGFFY